MLYVGNLPANRDFSQYVVGSGRTKFLTLFLGHLWSLCVEEQFYLIWPLMVWLARTRGRILGLGLAICGLEFLARLWVVTHHTYADAQNIVFRALPFRADTLMCGAVLAMLLRGPRADAWQRASKWVFAGALTTLLVMVAARPDPEATWQLSVGLSLVAAMCAGLVGAVLRPGSLWERAMSQQHLRGLGRISYGFYLFHLLFVDFCYWLIGAMAYLVHSLALGALLAVGFNFLVTVVLAKVSYERLELPFLRRKRFWAYDAEERRPKPVI